MFKNNIPNIITISRTVLLVPLIFLILTYNTYLLAVLYLIVKFMDFLDGFIARRYKLESKFGSILDSYSDIATDIIVIGGFSYLFTEYIKENLVFWLIPFGLLALSWVYSFLRTGRIMILHLYTNKLFGIFYVGYILMTLFGYHYIHILYIASVLGTLAAAEQLAIFTFYKDNVKLENTSIMDYIKRNEKNSSGI